MKEKKAASKAGMEKEDKLSTKYEMGGPVGAIIMIVIFQSILFFFAEKCQSGNFDLFRIPEFPSDIRSYFRLDAFITVIGWIAIQCILYLLPYTGKLVDGVPLKDTGKKLKYRKNGFFVLLVSMSAVFIAAYNGYSLSCIHDMILHLAVAFLVMSYVISTMLYIKSLSVDKEHHNQRANTGNVLYDWFHGNELNPRIGFLDIKIICFRNFSYAYVILNCINLAVARESGNQSTAILLLFVMQIIYIGDSCWFEGTLYSSREMVHDGVGFNTVFICSVLIFMYSSQMHYLRVTNHDLPWYCLLGIAALFCTGYIIYRGSNSQKYGFRQNPDDPKYAHLETIPTSSGKKILVSGWWGMCRHPNYLGDIIISLCFPLATGFNHVLPYLVFLFVFMLLLDRVNVDGEGCKKRYGPAWDIYCERVKYKILPGVF